MSAITSLINQLRTYAKIADQLEKLRGKEQTGVVKALYEAADTIEELSAKVSAQQSEWKLCDDTEEEPETEVLCCDRYGEEMIGYLSYTDADQWICESEHEIMYGPVAWRDKPEPWRGQR